MPRGRRRCRLPLPLPPADLPALLLAFGRGVHAGTAAKGPYFGARIAVSLGHSHRCAQLCRLPCCSALAGLAPTPHTPTPTPPHPTPPLPLRVGSLNILC